MVLAVALCPPGVVAQNTAPEFRARFEQETDPMHRAQMMPRLGQAEFDEITRDMDAGKLPEALAILKEYSAEIDAAEKGLDARHINAERHPKGYKQLEISLRQALRRLNGLLVSLAGDEQKPFLEVRASLDELNSHLIRDLFPNQPDKETSPSR
jgi:hypothetical protein